VLADQGYSRQVVTSVSPSPLATDTPAELRDPLSQALLRSPHLGELGSDGRSEPPLGGEAARAQHHDDATRLRSLDGERRRSGYRGDPRRDGGESTDDQATATSDTSTGKRHQAADRSAGPRTSSAETARHDDLSVDLPAATLWQRVTHGITRIFTGGERGTRTLDPGIMSAVL
jgi:hypothetical protein